MLSTINLKYGVLGFWGFGVLVVLQGDVIPSIEIFKTEVIVGDISLKYDEVLSCLFMAETRFLTEHNLLLNNIQADGIAI